MTWEDTKSAIRKEVEHVLQEAERKGVFEFEFTVKANATKIPTIGYEINKCIEIPGATK